MERRKIARLFQRRSSRTSGIHSDSQEIKALKPADSTLDLEKLDKADLYEPPGELATLVNSVSKLIVPKVKVDPWSIFWLIAVTLTAGTSLLSVLLLTNVPPVPNCAHISLLATDSERLYCAKLGAQTNKKAKVIEAINLVKDWTEMDPLYNDGKNLLGDWSRQLLRLSKQELAAGGDLKQAIADLKQIPTHSPAYKDAKETIDIWEEQWSDGKDIKVEFQKSLQNSDWNASYGYLNKVRSFKSAYWYRVQYHEMSLKLAKEKDAWDQYQDAERTAKRGETLPEFYSNDPETLQKAISIATTVTSNTYIKPQAEAQRAFWGRKLLAIAAAKYAAKDYKTVGEIAKKIPKNLATYSEAQYWLNLSQAPAGTAQPPNELARAHQVAQAGTYPAIQNAIAIAQQIQGQPLQTAAQQSIKTWSSTLHYAVDAPLIEQARAISRQGDLEGAIAHIQGIAPGRGLYRIAQADITFYKRQIRIKKDVKIFKEAEALFIKGKTQEAINLGNTILKDSPIYKSVQISVKFWQSTQKPKVKVGAAAPTKP